jgi:hypothetical protein
MKQIVRVSTHLYVLLQLNLNCQQRPAVPHSSHILRIIRVIWAVPGVYLDVLAPAQRVTPDMTYVCVSLEEGMDSTTWSIEAQLS